MKANIGMDRKFISYPAVLLGLFVLAWLLLAVNPVSRGDWFLENLLVLIVVPVLALTYRRFRFSNLAYSCFALFFFLHIIGAHYTYSLVPYDEWWRSLFNSTITDVFGFTRNHFDRLLHFLYGLLIVIPSGELLMRVAPSRGVWGWLLPVLFVTSHSVIYEVIEWIAAATVGAELGQAYLGTQGDVWDAQKDMALALVGSIVGNIRLSMRQGPLRA